MKRDRGWTSGFVLNLQCQITLSAFCAPRLVLANAGDSSQVKDHSILSFERPLLLHVAQASHNVWNFCVLVSLHCGCSAQRQFPEKCRFANTPVATKLCCKRRLCESQLRQLHLTKVLDAVVRLLHQCVGRSQLQVDYTESCPYFAKSKTSQSSADLLDWVGSRVPDS